MWFQIFDLTTLGTELQQRGNCSVNVILFVPKLLGIQIASVAGGISPTILETGQWTKSGSTILRRRRNGWFTWKSTDRTT